MVKAFKLLRMRRNGTIGPLFINRKQVIQLGVWMDAEDHHRKGYAHRPGWHVTLTACAPHLSMKGRVWMRVEVEDFVELKRPASQGGVWLLAQKMKVVGFL
jgi:hypothetical protein